MEETPGRKPNIKVSNISLLTVSKSGSLIYTFKKSEVLY